MSTYIKKRRFCAGPDEQNVRGKISTVSLEKLPIKMGRVIRVITISSSSFYNEKVQVETVKTFTYRHMSGCLSYYFTTDCAILRETLKKKTPGDTSQTLQESGVSMLKVKVHGCITIKRLNKYDLFECMTS